jgi:hypothetical protein
MTWRQIQLDSFKNPVMFQQDHELVEYMRTHGHTKIYAHGDVEYFGQFVELTDSKCEFGIYIINQPFKFSTLIEHVNWILDHRVHSRLYLAINKFFAVVDQLYDVDSNYDTAIEQLINQQVNAQIESYQYRADDQGQYFNFAHPVTRFYLAKL